ncbi:MAG: hypothetical protein FWH56_10505 [Betaproteobacteria bacterium]|nr:hypothetical protein [Betaproteobacteria bacterium]
MIVKSIVAKEERKTGIATGIGTVFPNARPHCDPLQAELFRTAATEKIVRRLAGKCRYNNGAFYGNIFLFPNDDPACRANSGLTAGNSCFAHPVELTLGRDSPNFAHNAASRSEQTTH